MHRGEDVTHMLNRVHVSPGEVYRVPPGIPHAWGGGTRLLEVSHASDLTYRLYDFGRNREIHREKALHAIDFGAVRGRRLVKKLRSRWRKTEDGRVETARFHPDFRIEKITLRDTATAFDGCTDGSFVVVVCLRGGVLITSGREKEPLAIRQGRAALIPEAATHYRAMPLPIEGAHEFIVIRLACPDGPQRHAKLVPDPGTESGHRRAGSFAPPGHPSAKQAEH